MPKPALRVPVSALNSIAQLCDLLDLHLKPAAGAGAQLLAATSPVPALGMPTSSAMRQADQSSITDVFVFCCVWSIGAAVQEADQGRFVKLLRQLSGLKDTEGSEAGVGSLPSGSLYDYRFDTGLGAWKVKFQVVNFSLVHVLCMMRNLTHAICGIIFKVLCQMICDTCLSRLDLDPAA